MCKEEEKSMNLKNECKEYVYKYDMDASDDEIKQLAKLGLKKIKKDENALVNYAVISILEEYIKNSEAKLAKEKK